MNNTSSPARSCKPPRIYERGEVLGILRSPASLGYKPTLATLPSAAPVTSYFEPLNPMAAHSER